MGFIKIDRSIQEWQWYKDGNTFRLYVHCLIKANWRDGKFRGELIAKGSFVTSLDTLSRELGITVQQTKTAIKHLVDCEYITSRSTNKYRIITVLNYEKYQTVNKQSTSNQQINNKQANNQVTINQQTNNKQVTTIEEVKEVKEVKEDKEVKESKEIPFNNLLPGNSVDKKPAEEMTGDELQDAMLGEENWIERINLIECWEEGFCAPPSSSIMMRLSNDVELYGKEKTYCALREAVIYGKNSIDYIEKILINWKDMTPDQILMGERPRKGEQLA